jgi:hypothetical protein
VSNFFMKTMSMVVVGKATSAAKAFVTGALTNSIARWLGLEDSLVAKVLMVGIPAMMMIASDDPVIAGNLFNRSKEDEKKRFDGEGRRLEDRNRKEQEEAESEFFDVFGEKGHAMNKVIAEETGATEEEVDGIMSAFLPEFERAIDDEHLEDAGALQRLFSDQVAAIKAEAPRWLTMMTKAIF